MKFKSTLFALLTLSTFAVKAENVQFQNIRVGGIGCPSEKTSIAYSPDSSTASLIFTDFTSHVPQEVVNSKINPNISQLPCNVFIEVKLPIGQKLDSLEVRYDMRGNAMLDQGVMGYFRSYVMSAAGLGIERSRSRAPELVQEKNWVNSTIEQVEDFTLQTSKKITFNSDCSARVGQDRVYIHLQHHILTQIINGGANTGTQGTIMVDSSDVSGGLKLLATTSACNVTGGNSGGGTGGRPTPPSSCHLERVNGRVIQVCN